MKDHPCFSCRLPDCDDTSPRCALRSAHREYQRLRVKKLEIPAELRRLYTFAYRELFGLHRPKRSGSGKAE